MRPGRSTATSGSSARRLRRRRCGARRPGPVPAAPLERERSTANAEPATNRPRRLSRRSRTTGSPWLTTRARTAGDPARASPEPTTPALMRAFPYSCSAIEELQRDATASSASPHPARPANESRFCRVSVQPFRSHEVRRQHAHREGDQRNGEHRHGPDGDRPRSTRAAGRGHASSPRASRPGARATGSTIASVENGRPASDAGIPAERPEVERIRGSRGDHDHAAAPTTAATTRYGRRLQPCDCAASSRRRATSAPTASARRPAKAPKCQGSLLGVTTKSTRATASIRRREVEQPIRRSPPRDEGEQQRVRSAQRSRGAAGSPTERCRPSRTGGARRATSR